MKMDSLHPTSWLSYIMRFNTKNKAQLLNQYMNQAVAWETAFARRRAFKDALK